jgi:hypothetical protein
MERRTLFLLVLSGSIAAGPCTDTAETQQWIIAYADHDSEVFGAWRPVPGEIHKMSLTSGYKFGIEASPASNEYYRKHLILREATPEMIEMAVYDLSGKAPIKLADISGGVNSVQGYSSMNGGSKTDELGSVGINFFLSKTNCITLEQITN